MHEDVKQLQKQELDAERAAIHEEERLAAEKQVKDRLRKFRARLNHYEKLLIANNIPLDPVAPFHSPTHPHANSPLHKSKPKTVLAMLEFLLSFLNIGDWIVSVIRTICSVFVPPTPPSANSPKLREPTRQRYPTRSPLARPDSAHAASLEAEVVYNACSAPASVPS
eukprot:c13925_g1_i2.p2 GENE.c13925_g1_i2~~c13925_g1_i2.p2  ORF type:complete len:167 (+),score=17.54 c13925_g1_i2:607-1107(+)